MSKSFNKADFQRKYLFAMGLIALISLSAFISMEWILRSQSDFSYLINISGRQRMLSQRISLLADRFLKENEENVSSEIGPKLRHDIDLFEFSHQQIVDGTWSEPPRYLSNNARSIYFSKLNLDKRVKEYVKYMRDILNEKEFTPYPIEALDQLLNNLDIAVKEFEIESKGFTQKLFKVELVLVIAVLITLGMIIIFIFAPLSNYLEHLFRQLQNEKQEAIKAKDLKSKFMANITHELRTPLNGMIGALELIDKKALGEKDKENIEIIESCAYSNIVLVNDLLDFEKMQKNTFRINKKWGSLELVADELKRQFNLVAKRKNLEFKIQINTEETSVFTDIARLKQILSNLLSNAFKFTDEGRIELNIRQDQTGFFFEVVDSGIGIPSSEIDLVFVDFYQTKESQGLAVEGTGLGLSIVKSLVELLGGKIRVDSVRGQGTTFSFSLELESKKAEQKRDVDDVLRDFSEKNINVLILEDNKTNQIIFGRFLEKLGIKFDIKENGLEGLEICEKQDFDIIFCDIQMPHMNGVEFLNEFKKKGVEKTKIIAFTANALPEDIQKYQNLGFDDVLSKPLTLKELEETLSSRFWDKNL